jgi:hypothetical protein
MRLWVHVIWLETNPQTTLQICGPKEDRKLEDFIRQWGEETAALAWYFYVNSEPRAYNLEPVNHVSKFQSKDGKSTYVNQVEDQSAVTRFPLSAFLATSEGYGVRASMVIDEFSKARDSGELKEFFQQHPEVVSIVRAMKKRVGSMKSSWGAANEIPLENGEVY